jgi:hypothetical protein
VKKSGHERAQAHHCIAIAIIIITTTVTHLHKPTTATNKFACSKSNSSCNCGTDWFSACLAMRRTLATSCGRPTSNGKYRAVAGFASPPAAPSRLRTAVFVCMCAVLKDLSTAHIAITPLQNEVFAHGMDGVVCFRIPSLVMLADHHALGSTHCTSALQYGLDSRAVSSRQKTQSRASASLIVKLFQPTWVLAGIKQYSQVHLNKMNQAPVTRCCISLLRLTTRVLIRFGVLMDKAWEKLYNKRK